MQIISQQTVNWSKQTVNWSQQSVKRSQKIVNWSQLRSFHNVLEWLSTIILISNSPIMALKSLKIQARSYFKVNFIFDWCGIFNFFWIMMNLTLDSGYDLNKVKIVIIRIRLFHGIEFLLNIDVFTRMVTAFPFRFWSDLAFCPSLKPKFRRIRSKCHPVVVKKAAMQYIHVHSGSRNCQNPSRQVKSFIMKVLLEDHTWILCDP